MATRKQVCGTIYEGGDTSQFAKNTAISVDSLLAENGLTSQGFTIRVNGTSVTGGHMLQPTTTSYRIELLPQAVNKANK